MGESASATPLTRNLDTGSSPHSLAVSLNTSAPESSPPGARPKTAWANHPTGRSYRMASCRTLQALAPETTEEQPCIGTCTQPSNMTRQQT